MWRRRAVRAVRKNPWPYIRTGVKVAAAAGYTSRVIQKAKRPRRVKKPRLHQAATARGTGGYHSKFYYGKRKVPKQFSSVVKGLAKNYQVYNAAARMTAAVGVQTASTVNYLFNDTDVTAILANINAVKTVKALFMSVTSELMLTNQDLGNVKIIIYDIIARRDAPSGSNVTDPTAAWQHSYADEGASNANWNVIGTTPFSSQLLTNYFKVLKATHVILAQGQSHVHRISFTPNKVWNAELAQYTTGSMKGFTCFQMVVAYGMPCNDSITLTQVSTGNVALDVVTRRQYKYTFLQDFSTNFFVTNSLPAAFGVSEHIVDIGSGSVAVDAQA